MSYSMVFLLGSIQSVYYNNYLSSQRYLVLNQSKLKIEQLLIDIELNLFVRLTFDSPLCRPTVIQKLELCRSNICSIWTELSGYFLTLVKSNWGFRMAIIMKLKLNRPQRFLTNLNQNNRLKLNIMKTTTNFVVIVSNSFSLRVV